MNESQRIVRTKILLINMEGPHSTMLLRMVTGLFVNTFFETLITKVQKMNWGGPLLMLLLKMDILASAIIYMRQSKTDLQ